MDTPALVVCSLRQRSWPPRSSVCSWWRIKPFRLEIGTGHDWFIVVEMRAWGYRVELASKEDGPNTGHIVASRNGLLSTQLAEPFFHHGVKVGVDPFWKLGDHGLKNPMLGIVVRKLQHQQLDDPVPGKDMSGGNQVILGGGRPDRRSIFILFPPISDWCTQGCQVMDQETLGPWITVYCGFEGRRDEPILVLAMIFCLVWGFSLSSVF